jgi:hypothetical protein
MNGSSTHHFMCLKTRAVIAANHMTPFPFPPLVVQYINDWAGKNKLHIQRDPVFTYHDQDITSHPADDDDEDDEQEMTRTPATTPQPLPLDGEDPPELVMIPPMLEEPREHPHDDADLSTEAQAPEPEATQPLPPGDTTDYSTHET